MKGVVTKRSVLQRKWQEFTAARWFFPRLAPSFASPKLRRKIVRAVSLKAKPSNILTRLSPFSCRSQPPLILDLFENVTLAPHRPSRASTISQTDFPTLIVTRARDLLFSLPFQPLARPNSEESEREGKIILRLTDLSAACLGRLQIQL